MNFHKTLSTSSDLTYAVNTFPLPTSVWYGTDVKMSNSTGSLSHFWVLCVAFTMQKCNKSFNQSVTNWQFICSSIPSWNMFGYISAQSWQVHGTVSIDRYCVYLSLSVGIGSSLAAERCNNVHESPVVLQSSLGSACLLLLLLLLVNLQTNEQTKSSCIISQETAHCSMLQLAT